MSDTNTNVRLLDAAEALIAQNGYANTSLREITASAKANLAAVNYHFGSKEGLVSAMLERRLKPLNEQRLMLLDRAISEAERESRLPDAELVLRAFIEPAFRFILSKAGGTHFLRLFSRIHADPDNTIRRVFVHHMAPVFMRFYEALKIALPHVAPDRVAPRLFFCIGAMGQGTGMLVDEDLCAKGPSLGLPAIPGPDEMIEELIEFVLRGMEAK